MAIIKKIYTEQQSPLLERLRELDKKRYERALEKYKRKIKKSVTTKKYSSL